MPLHLPRRALKGGRSWSGPALARAPTAAEWRSCTRDLTCDTGELQGGAVPTVQSMTEALGAGGERVRLAGERGELLAEVGEVDALGVGAAN